MVLLSTFDVTDISFSAFAITIVFLLNKTLTLQEAKAASNRKSSFIVSGCVFGSGRLNRSCSWSSELRSHAGSCERASISRKPSRDSDGDIFDLLLHIAAVSGSDECSVCGDNDSNFIHSSRAARPPSEAVCFSHNLCFVSRVLDSLRLSD